MKTKILFATIGIIIIAILITGGYALRKSHPGTDAPVTVFDPLNAAYVIDGSSVALIDGNAEQEAAPGSAETITTRIFGQPVFGNIGGRRDAAVILVQDTGGSGTFYYAAAAQGTTTGTQGTNAIFLGDRIAPDTIQIENDMVIVNYADREPGEPMSAAPTVGISKYLVLAGNALYDIPIADAYPLYAGLTWGDKKAATVNPGEQNVPHAVVGIEVSSESVTDITDLSAVSMPFDSYYKKKLAALGWTEDQTLAAGGPGAEITGYRKGENYIILSYASVFKNVGPNVPETCPCDMTFGVFAGSTEK